MKNHRIGLALGSGGAKGISHIAFLQVLDELGIKPSIIAGTSIGALVGALYAGGKSAKELLEMIDEIELRDLASMVDFSIFNSSALLKGDGVESFIEKVLPVADFESLQIPLKVVATDFWKRQQVVFESGPLVMPVRASVSLPAIFEPVQVEEQVLMDGGAVNPLPSDLIRDACDILIAIDVSGEKTPPDHDAVPGMFESVMSTFQIMQASIVASKHETCPTEIYVKPGLRNIRMLEFDRYEEILEGVKDDVARFRQELEAVLEKKSGGLFGFMNRLKA